jgi:hypothetical protein
MSDPTSMREFRTPDGSVMWIDRSAADVAEAERGTDMRGQMTVGSAAANELVECTKDGRYQIGNGVYRYKAGDKIPKSAILLKDGEAPSVALQRRPAKKRSAKGKGPAEKTGPSGPSETT